MWAWAKKLFTGNKGIIEEISDVADKWIPSETTKHKMSIEDLQAGDASQAAAQQMEFTSHESWFDIFVDGLNRLPRPLITAWVVGMLFGWIQEPVHLQVMSPMTLNIIWTVITFWFGSRVLFKDIPAVLKSLRK